MIIPKSVAGRSDSSEWAGIHGLFLVYGPFLWGKIKKAAGPAIEKAQGHRTRVRGKTGRAMQDGKERTGTGAAKKTAVSPRCQNLKTGAHIPILNISHVLITTKMFPCRQHLLIA